MTEFKVGDQVVVLHPATFNGRADAVYFGKQVRGRIEVIEPDPRPPHNVHALVAVASRKGGQWVDFSSLRHVRIDVERARELLAQAVETQGRDFVYNDTGDTWATCQYAPMEGVEGNRAKTGCLVGVALSLHGETRHLGSEGSAEGLRQAFPDMMTPTAAEYFGMAQVAQDQCRTWGEAYDYADGVLGVGA